VIENARMFVGAKAISTLSTGYLNSLEYAKTRVQGADLTRMTDKTAPRVTITHHPDVRLMLMRQKAYAEGLRALVFYTASQQDRAELTAYEGQVDDMAVRMNDLLLPIVKGYGSERAYELLATSLQVFGGAGFTQDYPVMASAQDPRNVYKVGLNTTRLLMSCGDLVVGWLLQRQAVVALEALAGSPGRDTAFYEGKVAAARWFAASVLPGLAGQRAVAEATDLSLMELDEAAF
jgi:hypothetical protein